MKVSRFTFIYSIKRLLKCDKTHPVLYTEPVFSTEGKENGSIIKRYTKSFMASKKCVFLKDVFDSL